MDDFWFPAEATVFANDDDIQFPWNNTFPIAPHGDQETSTELSNPVSSSFDTATSNALMLMDYSTNSFVDNNAQQSSEVMTLAPRRPEGNREISCADHRAEGGC